MYAIRSLVGSDVKGVGPGLAELLQHQLLLDESAAEIMAGLQEAERFRLIRVDRGMPAGPTLGIPNELRNIAGVSIIEAGQEYLDKQFTKRSSVILIQGSRLPYGVRPLTFANPHNPHLIGSEWLE